MPDPATAEPVPVPATADRPGVPATPSDAAASSEFPVAARAAAAYCGRAFREVTTATIHVPGGTGFTWEHDAHLFHRRAWTAEHLFGTADAHHLELADRLGL